jgi:hypothetical protein
MQVLQAARAHGMVHGLTVATGDTAARSVASFARSDRPATAKEMALAFDSVAALHQMTARGKGLGAQDRAALAGLSILLTTD